jgi:hypothetical protein
VISVEMLSAEEWRNMAEEAHLICFDEKRPPSMDRIDFALLNIQDDMPLNYCTCRELDAESVYWQYGGAFPNSKGTIHSAKSYARNIKWCFDNGYKRISTYVHNENLSMFRIQLKCGFRVIGMRNFKGDLFLELLLEASSGNE